jgi:hypothetical protein
MRTAKQAAASRANGQKSPGPVTAEGKAKSRFNALKHGIHAETQIMFDESAEDLAAFAAELHEQHAPANPTERFLVDTLIHNEWRLRRLRRVEAALWQTGVDSFLGANATFEGATSGDAFIAVGTAHDRLQRIVNCCERNYHRALKQLTALAQARRPSQPAESKTTSQSSGSFRNSPQKPVSQDVEPPPAAPETQPAVTRGEPMLVRTA